MHNMYSCIVICQAYMLLKLYHHFSSEALSNPCRRESLLWHPEKTPPGWGWWWSTRVSGGRWGVENRRKDGKNLKQWKLVYIIPQDFGNQKVVLAAGSSVINWCGVFWRASHLTKNWPPAHPRLLRSSGMPESARGCHLSHVVCQVGYQSKFWEILTSIFICLLLFIQDFSGLLACSVHINSFSQSPVALLWFRRLESSKCAALQVSSRRTLADILGAGEVAEHIMTCAEWI